MLATGFIKPLSLFINAAEKSFSRQFVHHAGVDKFTPIALLFDLHDAALDLARDRERIDRRADIVRRGDTDEFNHAGFAIHGDFDRLSAKWPTRRAGLFCLLRHIFGPEPFALTRADSNDLFCTRLLQDFDQT